MYRRDYIMRQIEFMVEVIQRITGLTAEKRYDAALTVIDESLESLFGLNGTLITRLFGREPLTQLTFGEEVDMRQAKLLAGATLLHEAGKIQREQGAGTESFQSFASALELFLEALLDDDGTPLPTYTPEVEALVAVLAPYHLPVHLNQLLLRYYHRLGQLDEAENVLFEMVDQAPGAIQVIEQGIAFYRAILAENDAVLLAGNLPRDEAEASLTELLNLRDNLQ
ncbi:DUF6483 family protein [Candidatus Leptofilum sp.]|uniref:DUF6483 family protein n=1 Tax=Candidatus Leptofilum sp. TaxID=3241576 RepID=UPI003B5C0888